MNQAIIGFNRIGGVERQTTQQKLFEQMNKQIDRIADDSSIFTEDMSQFDGKS